MVNMAYGRGFSTTHKNLMSHAHDLMYMRDEFMNQEIRQNNFIFSFSTSYFDKIKNR